ncbi:MAG: LptF/LptG family permease [Planctomycetota bacterium]|jgi:lipopolysaccharide export LptBFGC system permease protein LptF
MDRKSKMLFTLHRYVFRELLRVFILAGVALTLILSLGSILQPIQEYGVGPRQVAYLMGYFLPITLTFVLPMAALFAGALVTYPGMALAIIVAIGNLLLSFYVMPVFVHRAEQSFKADAKQILFRNIQRRRYYELPPDGRYFIYADQANMQNDTLRGAVVAEMKDNQIEKIIMAEVAKVIFNTHETFSEVQIIAYKSSQMGAEGRGDVELGSVTKEVGSLLGDEIKFKKIDEMRRIEADMMQFSPIAQLAREMYGQLIVELLARDIRSQMSEDRPQKTEYRGQKTEVGPQTSDFGLLTSELSLESGYHLLGKPNSVTFTARQCRVQGAEVELADEVRVVEYDTDKRPLRTLTCAQASLHLEGDPLAPTLTMDLRSPQEAGSAQLRMRYIIDDLIPPEAVEAKAYEFKTQRGSLQPEKLASALSRITDLEPSRALASLQSKLDRKIRKTFVEIKAEIHSRLVFGTGCVPMILIGIGLGIVKKGGHLLSAFGASCVPAAVLIVCIMSGKQLTENLSAQTVSGVSLMWAGLGFLALLAVGIYAWLLRH